MPTIEDLIARFSGKIVSGASASKQIPGYMCCMMTVSLLAAIQNGLEESRSKEVFTVGCELAFVLGLAGIGFPVLMGFLKR